MVKKSNLTVENECEKLNEFEKAWSTQSVPKNLSKNNSNLTTQFLIIVNKIFQKSFSEFFHQRNLYKLSTTDNLFQPTPPSLRDTPSQKGNFQCQIWLNMVIFWFRKYGNVKRFDKKSPVCLYKL